MTSPPWYTIENIDQLDSPSLVVYPDRIQENIRRMISNIDDITRLRPHIKTHKSAEVCKMILEAGVRKFKCATIAEAEMLATTGAPDVLLAYQPVGPKINRLVSLTQKFPATTWSCLVDNLESTRAINAGFANANQTIKVYIDLNVGMNRTGIIPGLASKLFNDCLGLKNLTVVGLHAYDGHLRDTDFSARTKRCNEAFKTVRDLQEEILRASGKKLTIIAGGTPTFSIHAQRKEIECSPGTIIYWDKGYEELLPDQHYLHAALVVTRVISVPAENIICVDLGHKAIAAENPLPNRVHFLNAPELEPIGHSEEHMVLRTTPETKFKVGDVLYGIPYHICPTVALYDAVGVVQNNRVEERWNTAARKRKISI